MLPTNNSERKQKLRRFSVYYCLSVAAICVIAFAFADGLGDKQQTAAGKGGNGFSSKAFAADSVLHNRLTELENMDNSYAAALIKLKTREGMRAADSLRRALPTAEQDFQFALDSVSHLSKTDSNAALRQTVDFFAVAYANRAKRIPFPKAALNQLPAALPPSVMEPVDVLIKNNPELKGEMLKKDIRIADLEAALSQMKKFSPAANGKQDDAKGSTANLQLQEDYQTLQRNYKALAETNTRLRNAAVSTGNAPATDAPESEPVKAARARAVKMEQQLQEMNADLSFSTVDCNLSRADVNQIIYNGKQRKALLQQALDILTSLKKSSDEEIQKRALQKISQLNRIAMTVRD